MEIFDLGRPTVHEHPFAAGSRRPSCLDPADTCGEGHGSAGTIIVYEVRVGRVADPAVSETTSAIEHQVWRHGRAKTAAHGAEIRQPFADAVSASLDYVRKQQVRTQRRLIQ